MVRPRLAAVSVLAVKDIVGDAPFVLVMADHVFAASLLRRLRATSVRPGEVVVAVDRSLGRVAGVDPADAMKIRLTGDRVEAIEIDVRDILANNAHTVVLQTTKAQLGERHLEDEWCTCFT